MIHSILLSAAMAHRSISLILSTFEGVLVPRKHSSMLRIKAKVSFYPCTDLIFTFFSSASKTFSSMRKETAAFPAHSIKTWKHNGVNNPCSTWRTHWLYPRFFSFSFFYEQLEDYGVNGIWVMGWKPLRYKRSFAR